MKSVGGKNFFSFFSPKELNPQQFGDRHGAIRGGFKSPPGKPQLGRD